MSANGKEYDQAYYEENQETRAAQRKQSREWYKAAYSYWLHKLISGNEMSSLLVGVPETSIEKARLACEKLRQELDRPTVHTKTNVSRMGPQ